MCNEVGHLYQGWKSHAGTDTLEFILHKYKPKDRRTTYVRAVCNIRPQKTEAHRTRLTAGGESDRLSRRGQHTNIRLEHHETPYKQIHLRRQIKIHVNGRKVFLPEQPDGQGRIYHDPAFNDTTRICKNI